MVAQKGSPDRLKDSIASMNDAFGKYLEAEKVENRLGKWAAADQSATAVEKPAAPKEAPKPQKSEAAEQDEVPSWASIKAMSKAKAAMANEQEVTEEKPSKTVVQKEADNAANVDSLTSAVDELDAMSAEKRKREKAKADGAKSKVAKAIDEALASYGRDATTEDLNKANVETTKKLEEHGVKVPAVEEAAAVEPEPKKPAEAVAPPPAVAEPSAPPAAPEKPKTQEPAPAPVAEAKTEPVLMPPLPLGMTGYD